MNDVAPPPIERVDAADIKVGDDIWFLGAAHRVLRITEHSAPDWIEPPASWRTAHGAGDWTITLIPGEQLEVVRP